MNVPMKILPLAILTVFLAATELHAQTKTKLGLPGENLTIAQRPAFLMLPPEDKRTQPQPWIFYAPTLPPLPDKAEQWMHEQFLAAGVAVAGVDVGEAFGSPQSHTTFDALYRELTEKRGFARQCCLLGRSRGGLAVSSWAIARPEWIAGLVGIYPVFDLRSYPSIAKAAPAYGLSVDELTARNDELNPVSRLGTLAKAGIPVLLLHGDVDKVVPLEANSDRLLKQYRDANLDSLVRLIVLKGQGHNMFEGFFKSQELVDFAIARARGDVRVVNTPLVLKHGGTADKPAVFDGRGMVIDLGIDVTDHSWQKSGDVWTSSGKLFDREPIAAGQVSGLFLDELPLSLPRDLAAEKANPERKQYCYVAPESLKPGQMGYTADGSLYFRWPESKDPAKTRLILPPKAGTSCVTVACSHITIRNITARHAANDGFNIHGSWVGVRLENVKAFSNADEGISAHDDVEMEVDGAEVAWNGSSAGGVADVNRCTTRYRNCRVHDNLAAGFHFSGKSHQVIDTLIYNQSKSFTVHSGTEFKQERVEERK
jgi:hypothetical protein